MHDPYVAQAVRATRIRRKKPRSLQFALAGTSAAPRDWICSEHGEDASIYRAANSTVATFDRSAAAIDDVAADLHGCPRALRRTAVGAIERNLGLVNLEGRGNSAQMSGNRDRVAVHSEGVKSD